MLKGEVGELDRLAAAGERAEQFRAVFADEKAFRTWYESALPYVYGFLLDRCGRRDVAEELTQETFVDVVRGRGRFDGDCDPLTWVCAIARHKLADHFRRVDRDERRRLRLRTVHPREESLSGPGDGDDAGEIVRGSLGSLPSLQRAALVFHYLDGLSVMEVAVLLDRSESAVESLLARARESFKHLYREGTQGGIAYD
jgi:RNA polymerase sigma-70 factor (ECF subfamily)